MMSERYRINVEVLENAFEVEVPDIAAFKKAQAAAKKQKSDNKSPCAPSPYMGDFMKKYAAKGVKEVLALVRGALEKMPENEYDAAFAEAAAKA